MQKVREKGQLKRDICSCGLDAHVLEQLRPAMCERNLRILSYTSAMLASFGTLFLTISLVSQVGNPFLYAFLVVSGALILVAKRFVRPTNTFKSLLLCYTLTAVTLVYAIALSFIPSNIANPSVSFLAFMVLAPLTILDVAWHMYVFSGTFAVVFLVLSFMLKPSATAITDGVNVSTFVVLAMMLYTLIANEYTRGLYARQCAQSMGDLGEKPSFAEQSVLGGISFIDAAGRTLEETDSHNAHAATKSRRRFIPRIQIIDAVLISLGTLLSVVGISALVSLTAARNVTADVREKYEECIAASTELMEASDLLTMQARMYVVTTDEADMNAYLNELTSTRRRNHAVATLRQHGEGTVASLKITEALRYSNELAVRELYAMKLTAVAKGVQDLPGLISNVELSQEDRDLSADQKRSVAEEMMFGIEYEYMKGLIVQNVDDCSDALISDLWDERMSSLENEIRLQTILYTALILDVVLLVVAGVSNYFLVMRPLKSQDASIQNNEPLEVKGSLEVRNVAESYNKLYKENMKRTMLLQRQAQTDALTGLLNRGAFDRLLQTHGENVALLIVDVDLFKAINDNNGHEVGDKVLVKVARSLQARFRTTDYVCRIGGDEFAVMLININSELRSVVANKLQSIYADLADTTDGLPAVTLSIGIAFNVSLPRETNLYHAADEALYKAKRDGRNGYVFYGGE